MLKVGTKAPSFALKDQDGVVRTTYLIDEEGAIVQAFGKVKPKDSAKQVLEALA